MRPSVLLALAACAGDPVDVTFPADERASGAVVLTDAHNYGYAATLAAPTVATAEAADLTLDWAGVTRDFACAPVDPAADVATVGVYAFPDLEAAAVADALLHASLTQADIGGVGELVPGGATSAALSEVAMTGVGSALTDWVEGAATWAVVALGGSDGSRPLGLVFVAPTGGEVATTVPVPEGCGALSWVVDLEGLASPPVAAEGPWTVDWSGLTRTAEGVPLDLALIDGLWLLGFGDGLPVDLAGRLGALPAAADVAARWTVAGASTLDLSTPPTEGETPATLDPEATWVLALSCGSCLDSAPPFLTVLTLESP